MGKPKKKDILFGEDSQSNSSSGNPDISIHLEAKAPILTPLNIAGDKRGAPRFKVQLEAVLFYNGISFRTKSLNLSTSGVLLADSVPASFVNQILDIVMVRNAGGIREFFLLKGKALEAPLRSPRVQFTQVPDIQKRKLSEFLRNQEPA